MASPSKFSATLRTRLRDRERDREQQEKKEGKKFTERDVGRKPYQKIPTRQQRKQTQDKREKWTHVQGCKPPLRLSNCLESSW